MSEAQDQYSLFNEAEYEVYLQKFGSYWTEDKLKALEKYFGAYMDVMKNQHWASPFYVDAFSGSGYVELKDGNLVEGSALRSLNFNFAKFFFIDLNKKNIETLKEIVTKEYPDKIHQVTFINDDANDALEQLVSPKWKSQGWRGIAFLDPFATEVKWSSLEKIASSEVLDTWYLFPLMALNRMLTKSGDISEDWQRKITSLLGTDEWMEGIYQDSGQMSIFDDDDVILEKQNIDGLRKYILSRLRKVFPLVSDKAVVLRNKKHPPLFLLCFMGSNPSKPAKKAAQQIADHLLLTMGRE